MIHPPPIKVQKERKGKNEWRVAEGERVEWEKSKREEAVHGNKKN